jgi:hypothetical protein
VEVSTINISKRASLAIDDHKGRSKTDLESVTLFLVKKNFVVIEIQIEINTESQSQNTYRL